MTKMAFQGLRVCQSDSRFSPMAKAGYVLNHAFSII